MSIYTKLLSLQQELKAPKNQFNSYGGYKYRSCEDILEAVKPLCAKHGVLLNLSDTVQLIGDRYYITATATCIDAETGETISSTASAREAVTRKGMDDSQISGTASSYARKYALNAVFLIDDTKDADTDEHRRESTERASRQPVGRDARKALCSKCGQIISPCKTKKGSYTAEQVAEISATKYGAILCANCMAQAAKAPE